MMVSTFKFLTNVALMLAYFASSTLQAQIFTPENGKTHLRWNLFAAKEQIVISKRANKLTLKTLNAGLFNTLKSEIEKVSKDKRYITDVRYIAPEENNNVSTIEVTLTNPEVEVFSFYRDRDKKYVVDFWMDIDKLEAVSEIETKDSQQQADTPVANILPRTDVKSLVTKTPSPIIKKVQEVSQWRDFRYGASFVWDYPALSPQLSNSLDITRKTPEYFYPIKDRDYNKGEKEAHLQLCINLYRKKEWGLMAKSIELFQRKYGAENDVDLLEYLKANAMVRENLDAGNTEPYKSAISMFSNIAARTVDYDLKKATTKYLIAYDSQANDYISVLKRAKEFYVVSKENHDYEESTEAAKTILHALANLKQIEKIDELLQEKTIAKILPAQLMLAYKMYAQLALGKVDEVIKTYNAAAPGLVKPVHEAILYNAAEAKFRKADFEASAKLFDEFIAQHSYHTAAADARTRLALSYELAGRDVPLVIKLYREAIDRSGPASNSTEARIRYVALTNLRKKKPDTKDLEFRVLLDRRDGESTIDKDLQKLLWQVRLRNFIVDKQYDKALAYLTAIPLTGLSATDRRVFEGDGAEIIYGLMLKSFADGSYAQVVKTWETYKDRYVEKVANDPHLNHLVGKSLIKLGLFRGYEDISTSFRKLDSTPTRTFPLWVDRPNAASAEVALAELDIIKSLKSSDSAVEQKIVNFAKLAPNNPKTLYYRALAARARNDAANTIKWMEDFLVSSGNNRDLDSEEIAEMVMGYTDALYQTNQITKFEKVSKALLEDTEKLSNSNPFMAQVSERIAYLNIEVMAGKGTELARSKLEKGILAFNKSYPQSQFRDRLGFLLGNALIQGAKVDQGVKIFNDMLSDGKVSDTVKEMIKSELSLLKIKERTLL